MLVFISALKRPFYYNMEQTQPEQQKQGFFSRLKNFFRGEQKSEQVEVEGQPQEVVPQPIIKYEECFWCKNPVYEGEKFSNQQGKHFHRKCYKHFLSAGYRGGQL